MFNIFTKSNLIMVIVLLALSFTWCKKRESPAGIKEPITNANAEKIVKGVEEEVSTSISEKTKQPKKEKTAVESYPEAKGGELHPNVKAAIRRVISEIGGNSALEKLRSYTYESSIDFDGISMTAKNYWLAPDSFRTEYSNKDILQVSSDIFYEVSGAIALEPLPEEKERLKMSNWARYIGTLSPFTEKGIVIGMDIDESVFRKKVLKFKIKDEISERVLFIYFDMADFRLLAIDYDSMFKGEKVRVVERFSEHRMVSNVLFPHRREVTFYNATNYKYGWDVLKETVISVDFTPVDRNIFKRSNKPLDDTIYYIEIPEITVAFRDIKTQKDDPDDFDDFLHSLKKEEVALVLQPMIIYQKEVIIYQKEARLETLYFSPHNLIWISLHDPPWKHPEIANIAKEIFVTVSNTNLPQQEDESSPGRKILDSSTMACVFLAFKGAGEVDKLQSSFLSLKERLAEKGTEIVGLPTLFIVKSDLYGNDDRSKENIVRLCYPIAANKK